jgi:hypothetical protein
MAFHHPYLASYLHSSSLISFQQVKVSRNYSVEQYHFFEIMQSVVYLDPMSYALYVHRSLEGYKKVEGVGVEDSQMVLQNLELGMITLLLEYECFRFEFQSLFHSLLERMIRRNHRCLTSHWNSEYGTTGMYDGSW